MDNRIDGFKCLINSLSRYFDCGWRACAIAQGYNEEQKQDMAAFLKDKPCDIFYFSDYIGAHSAKVYGLENVKSDIWCSLDDDMEIIEKTDYEAVAETLNKEKSYGFISCNWARTMALADKKAAENKYIKQKNIVNFVVVSSSLTYESLESQKERKGDRKILEEIVAENFSNLLKGKLTV